MKHVPNKQAMGYFMYAMVETRPNITKSLGDLKSIYARTHIRSMGKWSNTSWDTCKELKNIGFITLEYKMNLIVKQSLVGLMIYTRVVIEIFNDQQLASCSF
jgi:hypothetical protein